MRQKAYLVVKGLSAIGYINPTGNMYLMQFTGHMSDAMGFKATA